MAHTYSHLFNIPTTGLRFFTVYGPNKERIEKNDLYKVYNIGNNNSVKLLDFIKEIEINLETEAEKNMLPIQPGDVERTWANVDDLINDYDYKPNTTISHGVKAFVNNKPKLNAKKSTK